MLTTMLYFNKKKLSGPEQENKRPWSSDRATIWIRSPNSEAKSRMRAYSLLDRAGVGGEAGFDELKKDLYLRCLARMCVG